MAILWSCRENIPTTPILPRILPPHLYFPEHSHHTCTSHSLSHPVHQGAAEFWTLCCNLTSPLWASSPVQTLAVTLAGVQGPSRLTGAIWPQHTAQRALLQLLWIITFKVGMSYFTHEGFVALHIYGSVFPSGQFSRSLDSSLVFWNSVLLLLIPEVKGLVLQDNSHFRLQSKALSCHLHFRQISCQPGASKPPLQV